MLLRNTLIALSVLLAVSGCANLRGNEVPEVEVVEKVVTQPPELRPIDLSDITWSVVSPRNLDAYLNSIGTEGDFVFYALSVEDYANLSLNMDEIRRFILQQQDLILYYEESVK